MWGVGGGHNVCFGKVVVCVWGGREKERERF